MAAGDSRAPSDVIRELRTAYNNRGGLKADRQRRGLNLRILTIELEVTESAIATLGVAGVTGESLELRDRIYAQFGGSSLDITLLASRLPLLLRRLRGLLWTRLRVRGPHLVTC